MRLPIFCRRCHYCVIPIVATGDAALGGDGLAVDTHPPREASDLDALVVELAATVAAAQAAVPAGAPHPYLVTVYIGGGTPSLTSTPGLLRLLAAARSAFSVAPAAKVMIDMDSGTFSAAKTTTLASAGATRASGGVQALDDRLLAVANQPHTGAEAVEVVRRAAAAVPAVSVDLMCGLAGQTRGAWPASLAAAAALRPAHGSAYAL